LDGNVQRDGIEGLAGLDGGRAEERRRRTAGNVKGNRKTTANAAAHNSSRMAPPRNASIRMSPSRRAPSAENERDRHIRQDRHLQEFHVAARDDLEWRRAFAEEHPDRDAERVPIRMRLDWLALGAVGVVFCSTT
jgi:hypothetical protein